MTATCLLIPRASSPHPGLPGDPELAQRRERDALVEDRVAIARDLLEERSIDGRHDEARALVAAVLRGELRHRGVVMGARAFGLELHQLLEGAAAAAREDVLVGHAHAGH